MNKALVIGGGSGIGLAIALELSKKCESVTIVDRKRPQYQIPYNVKIKICNLLTTDFLWLTEFDNVDVVFYSAGFGRVAPFEALINKEIDNSFTVNTISTFKVLKYFMPKLKSLDPFYCGVMTSIAGRVASPLFSIYSATKAALFRGIEAINTELIMSGSPNRIMEISPGSINGTGFNGGLTDFEKLHKLSEEIVDRMLIHQELFIPDFNSTFKDVIERYTTNPSIFAQQSYLYKLQHNRMQNKPQLTIGYLSGTFDLFHIGHLNLLKKAKELCDYLVVGVHKDASHKGKQTFIPFSERKEIVANIKFVDKVIDSEKEDSDIYTKGIVKYDKLFVGSDYKGTERFNQYEKFFSDKGVEIVYFPYTQGTSSTLLREALTNNGKQKQE